MKDKKKNKKTLFIAIALLFAIFEIILFFTIDLRLSVSILRFDINSPVWLERFRAIRIFGEAYPYLWLCGVIALVSAFLVRGKDVPTRWRLLCGYAGVRAYFIFASLGLSQIACTVLNYLIGRARPVLWIKESIYGFNPLQGHLDAWQSMPAAPAATAFALGFAFAHLYPRLKLLWLTVSVVVAACPLLINMNYLSDIGAGAMVGWLAVTLFLKHGMTRTSKVIFPIDSSPRMK